MYRRLTKNLLFVSLIASFLGLSSAIALPSALHAQDAATQSLQQRIQDLQNQGYNPPTLPSGFTSDSISIATSPEVPGPNQSVTLTLTSFSTDLNRATIAWYQDNKLITSGIGDESAQIMTGNVGVETSIVIVVNDAEGNTTRQTLNIIPAEVDLVWQADTYTPPFYEGKALYTHQSTLHIAAIPNFVTPAGKRLDPKTLVYSWKRDDGVNGTVSGYGMQSFDITDNIPAGPVTVDVTVTSLDGTVSAEKQLAIQSGTPTIALYQNDPLLGTLYQYALPSAYDLTDKEISVTAVPYFFSTTNGSSDIQYVWSLNGSPVAGQTSPTITLRNQNNQVGSASLSVGVNQIQDEFQTGNASLSVTFGGTSSQNGNTFPL